MSDSTTAVSQYTYGVNLQNNSGSNKPVGAGGMYVSGVVAGTHDNAVKFIFNSAVSASIVSASYFFGDATYLDNVTATSVGTFSGSKVIMLGTALFSNAASMKLSGTISGAAGATLMGPVILSHGTSMKASGSVSSATTVSGTVSLASAKLTINGNDVITQAGSVAVPGDVSGAATLKGAALTINNTAIVTQAKALGGVTTISGASSLAGAKLTINGNDVITQAGAGAFAGNISGTSDIIANRLSGAARGITVLGNAIFSNNMSVSGGVVGATTLSGAGAISAQSLTIGNKAIISQAGAVGNATTVSGASSLAGAKLTINGNDVITQAGSVAVPGDLSGAGDIKGAALTINNNEVITQAGVLQNVTFSPSALSGNVKLNIFPESLFSNAASAIKASGSITGSNIVATTTVSGTVSLASSKLTINGNDVITQAGAGAFAGNISGTSDIIANRLSGAARGITVLGNAIFSNNMSVSGGVVGATTLSGAGAVSAQSLTIGNKAIISQAGAIGNATTVSGASSLAGAKLTINGNDVITQAGNVAVPGDVSGAGDLKGAALTINGAEIITQAKVLQNVTFSPSALSGNVKLNIFPTALFSNAASMKLSGTISGAGGAVLGGPAVISHNLSVSGAVVGATTLSGAGMISGQKLGVSVNPDAPFVAHIGGATSTSGSIIVGKMGTGHNINFYGDTMGRQLFWDQAGDTLHLSGTTRLSGAFTVGGKEDPGTSESQGYDVSFYGHDSDKGSTTGSFFWDASAEKLLLGSGSLIGIGLGATNVSYAIHLPNVAGAAGQMKANAFVTYSSRKMKTNINPIHNPLDKVMKLQGVTYNWKSSPNSGKDLGLIAEDVREVLPHVVHEAANGHAGIDYARITSLLVEAVKEQQKQIQELKSKLEKS